MNNMQVTVDGMSGTIQQDGMVRFGSDDRMNVLFYDKVVIDPVKSREMGRPFSNSVPYVRIQQPGERDYVDRPIRENDDAIRRWPRHYEAYKQGRKPAPAGTPLEILFPQHLEIAANLHGLGIHTVEQLAGLTEHGAQTVGMGATMWRENARKFLDAAKGGVSLHKMQKELEDRDNQIEVLRNQMALQKTQIDRLMAMVDQKIPSSAVPPLSSTLAQDAFSRATPRMTFDNDGPSESDAIGYGAVEVDVYADPPVSNEPLFIEQQDTGSVAGPTISETPSSKPRGWPKGKPRGSRN